MFLQQLERQAYQIAKRTVDKKLKQGVEPHSKRIARSKGMKEYVRMFRWTEFDTVIELKSEPFDTLVEAEHFSMCFNDNFLYDSYCKEENGKYYVYTGWILKHGFVSYSVMSKGEYFEFANWS